MGSAERKLRNIALTLAFDGTAYHGWQVQANAVTVQRTLQDAMEKVLRARPDVVGCSRTDAGVHAAGYVCNFRTRSALPCGALLRAFNSALPPDMAVTGCRESSGAFHARYSARAKEYAYRFWIRPARNPFWARYSLHYPHPFDVERVRAAAGQMEGTHDFSSFCAAGGSVPDHVRTVLSSTVEQEDGMVVFRVRADGFLYHMVRIMAGTLLRVARGRLRPDEIRAVLGARARSSAGPTAPAHALCLERVFYPGGAAGTGGEAGR